MAAEEATGPASKASKCPNLLQRLGTSTKQQPPTRRALLHRDRIFLDLHLRWARNEVTRRVRQDDSDYYTSLARAAGDADGQENGRRLWAKLKPILPKNILKNKHNLRCRGPEPDDLMRHFAALEAGERRTIPDILRDCRTKQIEEQPNTQMYWGPVQLPSRHEVEQLCSATPTHKAPGMDKLDPTAVRYGGYVHGRAIVNLFMKMWIQAAEPGQWKGGALIPIYKGKGPLDQPEGQRGIMLLSSLGKKWHALLRKRLLRVSAPLRPPHQIGGYPGQQTGFATLVLHSLDRQAKHHGLPNGVLFLDIKGAFHHMIRETYNHDTMPDVLKQALVAEGLDLQQIWDHATGQELEKEPGLRQVLADAHTNT